MKFSKEQLNEFEKKFGNNERIKLLLEDTEYSTQDDNSKGLIWFNIAPAIMDEFNFVIPGTEKKILTKEEIEKEDNKLILHQIENKKKLNLKIQKLIDKNIKRVYLYNPDLEETTTCNILSPLPFHKKRCIFPLDGGKIEIVKYEENFSNYKAIQFTETTVGISTSGMSDCIGVMFFVGKERNATNYWGGSLAHLPGGNAKGLNWKKMIFDIEPNDLRLYLQIEPLYAQALICVTPNRIWDSDDVENLIKETIIPLGFGYPQIMIYIGDIPGFAIHKNGCFGVIE